MRNDGSFSQLNKSYNIRNLYKPIQPTVKKTANKVTYCEFFPATQLQNFICCYWELKTTKTLHAPFNYRVVADGCIDIFFARDMPSDSFVMGFCKKYTVFPLANSFHYIGIRFLPTAFPQIFNISAYDLSDRFEKLALVVPGVAEFITNNLSNELSMQEVKNTLDHYFLSHLAHTSVNCDSRLHTAIGIILKNSGVVNIEKDLDAGISQRQLRRLFEFYVGDSAKVFSKVVRFQNILKAKPSHQSLTKNKLFFDLGYYDQSHFIKEFKSFYGVTPSQAFKNE